MAESATMPLQSSADAGRAVLDLHLLELRQIFNSLDPAPFRERDLDPRASDYIVDWAEETPKGRPLALRVSLGRERPAPGDEALLGDAVREYFKGRAASKRLDLSRLLRVGRISMLIGIVFLGVAIVLADMLASTLTKESWAWLVKESLIIGGWVALWRPMEIFLYDWWPIRARARLFDRLGAMHVDLLGVGGPAAATPS